MCLHRGKPRASILIVSFASREIEQGGNAPVAQAVPRPEYPRPQFVRDRWLNLNGVWSFGFGASEVATEAADTAAPTAWTLDSDILVPFAPESERSGIASTTFHPAVRYQRTVAVPADWADDRLLLHFGAVDFDTTVWVDDVEVGRHRGGFTPFTIDITDAVAAAASDTFTLSVLAEDDHLTIQARGKQSRRPENYEAFYTRTTGIWQTVWLEPVSPAHFGRPVIRPDLPSSSFAVELDIVSPAAGLTARVDISDADGLVATREVEVTAQVKPVLTLPIPADRLRTWSPEDPHLYTVRFTMLRGGTAIDVLDSSAGMRSVAIDGRRVLLNGRPVFQRLVLDQGYWPDTLMTAPSDDALVADIELGMAAGFNGARLHQKVFEERYLFHADRLGYLVWGEFADWGAKVGPGGPQEPTLSFVTEWVEALTRDLSHPSIVGWCPLNETFQPMTDRLTVLDDATKALYAVTKAIDPTRPVIDASGYSHRVPGADIYDSHLYEQDPDVFAQRMGGLADGRPYVNTALDGTEWSVPYAGQPYFCSEFGGIWWSDSDRTGDDSWGYGEAPRTREEWIDRFRRLVDTLLDDAGMFGYCFTQLTDVFQEKNGVLDFRRVPKFDLRLLRDIQSRPAAYELDDVPPLDP